MAGMARESRRRIVGSGESMRGTQIKDVLARETSGGEVRSMAGSEPPGIVKVSLSSKSTTARRSAICNRFVTRPCRTTKVTSSISEREPVFASRENWSIHPAKDRSSKFERPPSTSMDWRQTIPFRRRGTRWSFCGRLHICDLVRTRSGRCFGYVT